MMNKTSEAAKTKKAFTDSIETIVRVRTNGADRTNPQHAAYLNRIDEVVARLCNETSADFWYAHRHDDIWQLVLSEVNR